MFKKTALTVGLCLSAGLAAFAIVVFDPLTGEGFVGKGDVQAAFGWNNAQLQANAGGVSFTVEFTTSYTYECEWWTGPDHNRTYHSNSHTVGVGVDSEIAFDPRVRRQITGFILTGYAGEPFSEGEVPVDGGPCPGFEGNGKSIVPGSIVATPGEGGLYVHFGDHSALLD